MLRTAEQRVTLNHAVPTRIEILERKTLDEHDKAQVTNSLCLSADLAVCQQPRVSMSCPKQRTKEMLPKKKVSHAAQMLRSRGAELRVVVCKDDTL
mmetsp:Transcript_180675/g.573394  ORF Transcript_180675/g.573394 Transcript_180675/m.573394 type:complete len:96 (-) Transcript_180675:750-1037(-)